jgi:hypothetical protein
LIGRDMLRPLIPVQSVRRLKLELRGDRHVLISAGKLLDRPIPHGKQTLNE